MTVLWWNLVRAWWKPALIIAAVLGVVWYINHTAVQNERMKQKLREAEAYEKTMEAINEAIDGVRTFTVDDARAWLREYSQQ